MYIPKFVIPETIRTAEFFYLSNTGAPSNEFYPLPNDYYYYFFWIQAIYWGNNNKQVLRADYPYYLTVNYQQAANTRYTLQSQLNVPIQCSSSIHGKCDGTQIMLNQIARSLCIYGFQSLNPTLYPNISGDTSSYLYGSYCYGLIRKKNVLRYKK